MKKLVIVVVGLIVVGLVYSPVILAAPITGTPSGPSTPSWTPNSTNALNYYQLVPGREGQLAPYVLFNNSAVGQVTLDFYNGYTGGAFFEYRIDGVALTPDNTHPVVLGDDIYPGKWLGSGTASLLSQTFAATQTVEIRLALGGERDWDFDWVRQVRCFVCECP